MKEADQEKGIFLSSKSVWEKSSDLFPQIKLSYPDENVVRLFSGRYVKIPQPPAKLLDHGFGYANNLIFFETKGYTCYGCEIGENFVDEGKQLFKSLGKKVDLRVITGIKLPYENQMFDIIVSWNVIHYTGTRSGVESTLAEFRRILKPGGVLLLSTVHPESVLAERFEALGDGSYLIVKESPHDNRKGLTFFMAESEVQLQKLFSNFSEVRIGKIFIDLCIPTRRNAWYFVYAIK